MKTLYEVLGMKAKNSVFKSVFITDRVTSEGYNIIEVEPYDDTFLNAINTVSKYDRTTDRIFKKIYETFGADMWVILYTDYGQSEHLLSEYYMKEYGLI